MDLYIYMSHVLILKLDTLVLVLLDTGRISLS